ncbi:MAG TPA: endolytic transglycosylase MltG, partial [Candidatus Dojkabacteria bacterium]|nr:endolytic transglycosylase MltG [Candidatus Dojkabacteria bacterium]
MKLIKTTFFVFLIVVGFFAAYFYMQYKDFTNTALGSDTTRVKIVVEKGMTGTDVLNKLVEQQVITSNQSLYLRVYLKLNNVPNFQEGVYYIPRNLTVNELFDTLQHPESPDIWITIREGARADQIAGYFADAYKDYPQAVYNKDKFLALVTDKEYIKTLDLGIPNLKTLEGFLYPDKYLMPKEAT